MRRTAALKVLAGAYLFILLGSMASEEGRRNVRPLLATGIIIGFFVVLAWLRDRPRQAAMKDEARRLRLRYSEKDPFALLDEPFELFRRSRRSYGDVTNVLWGSWRDLEVRAFDYEYSRSENDWRRLSCAVVAIPGGWPSLVVQPEALITTAADSLAMPDIEFESELFNRAFEIRCAVRRFASAAIDARMMEWLLELTPRPGFEICGTWILGYRDQVQPWEIESVLEMLSAFVDRIPRALSSLYPEALPSRPDRPA